MYAPWCGHCKNLKPVYEEFAQLVSSSPASESLLIAKMNGVENTLPHKQFTWSGYPTIWFIKAGSQMPVPFTGPRTVRGFYDFVQKHATKAPLQIDGMPEETRLPADSSAATAVDSASFERFVLNSDKVGREEFASLTGLRKIAHITICFVNRRSRASPASDASGDGPPAWAQGS